MICHITTREAWEAAQGVGEYKSPEFDQLGFIHCSAPEQILLVANSFFAGRTGLVMLVINKSRLKSPIRWEPPHSTGRLPGFTKGTVFPHVYGPINTDAVVRTVALEPSASGIFKVPRPG